MLLGNFLLNVHFYPQLLNYQSASIVAQLVRDEDTPMIEYLGDSFALNFYYRKEVELVKSLEELKNRWRGKTLWIYTGQEGYDELKASNLVVETNRYPNYHITKLKGSFLNPSTRTDVIRYAYLVKVMIPY